jgi:hypothetical protein
MFRQLKRELPEIERVGFMPVKSTVGLQGADMIAYETYLYGIECLRNPDNPVANPHFQEYVRRPIKRRPVCAAGAYRAVREPGKRNDC